MKKTQSTNSQTYFPDTYYGQLYLKNPPKPCTQSGQFKTLSEAELKAQLLEELTSINQMKAELQDICKFTWPTSVRLGHLLKEARGRAGTRRWRRWLQDNMPTTDPFLATRWIELADKDDCLSSVSRTQYALLLLTFAVNINLSSEAGKLTELDYSNRKRSLHRHAKKKVNRKQLRLFG